MSFGAHFGLTPQRLQAGTQPERLALERAKPLRAPLVIAAGAVLRHKDKIPV